MSINKKTVDLAIFECERFLERAKLVASLGYQTRRKTSLSLGGGYNAHLNWNFCLFS